ncbi:PTS sugar transporter subunit IIB [Listeria fleischmannii]|jgi:PTS system cellobiose-specific IIB component|uniref:PTS system beta-glucoside-specific, IIB component n=2 Tax=Listeria fleischmannii TaxID=1069827 RepID=W7E1E7_9LIST|nr:PTS sugar transporter subunit IIB [Listeria fleischmannii]EIA20180.1 PTS system beta-glucoside-specific, IIB component [Listeria fleischmannii subsp. coloradonensis]EUJ62845.1 PTS system beta-glucoside-specific, IIB component [Listeria fleischmannii FSL S10-1203]MBC1398604.1 PTS sugar transporter subunit IIB [Listeria fleischmannii]MBC1426665.1 PTS sugar transporter subunit IIB [Listeria fleischmannii]STY46418.1 Lichenan-specific phosphotransferase enzyme IIB component [Listeria fleischmann
MKNIVLICAAGMSTSLLVTKMEKAAEAKGDDAKIAAYSIAEVNDVVKDADVVLLGPQVRYQEKTVKDAVAGRIPVDVIDMLAYGKMDGETVYAQALKLIEENK